MIEASDHRPGGSPGRPLARWLAAWLWPLLCFGLAGCDPRGDGSTGDAGAGGMPPVLRNELAGARCQVAQARVEAGQPAAALAWLATALQADPSHPGARALAGRLLAGTTWLLPETWLAHGMPVTHLHSAGPSSLWVALGGEHSTVVRWNLAEARIEAVLFPLREQTVRSLVFDRDHRWLVIERAGTALLCDARTLQPIRDLGALPAALLPAATVSFSPDGLLMAQPAVAAGQGQGGTVWQLREAKSGEILRSVAPGDLAGPPAIAAFLGRDHLRILRQDGSLARIPVSPVEPPSTTPAEAPVALEQALFTPDGSAALARLSPAPHSAPQSVMIDLEEAAPAPPPAWDLLARQPWSRQPSIWSGLMREDPAAPVIAGPHARFPASGLAELRASADFTAVAATQDHLVIGTQGGDVGFLRLIRPAPPSAATPPAEAAPDASAAEAFSHLAAFLAGVVVAGDGADLEALDVAGRLQAFEKIDFTALGRLFPGLDPAPWQSLVKAHALRHFPDTALEPLAARLLRASSRPEFPEAARAFESGDATAVLALISQAGSHGPAAARNLQLALASTRPEWIAACLAKAAQLPPLVRRIAHSRIAWLEGRKADAIAGWPDEFPTLEHVRLREDWDGWEAADFAPALDQLRRCVSEELAKLQLPDPASPEQRKALIAHLTDPQTVQSVGKRRFARACLDAALALAAFKDETEATFQLAALARNLGEDPVPCLRAEAMALTALGDYQQARERWVSLLSDHPVAKHQPGDYAEAAYTAFENADPRQAMAILTTGIHRFPEDANFALRAGWVALLTGNAEPAYRFLLAGRQIGYPEEKLENATALLAIAAVQTGAIEDAGVFYQDLIRMDPAWEDPATIDTLEWPEELKASLRQLAW